MQWMILAVLFLAVVWLLLRQRRGPPLPPKPKIDPRRLLSVRLAEQALEARRAGRYAASQAMALKATWLRLEPPLGQDDPPAELNPNDLRHLEFVDEIRVGYGEFLQSGQRPYAACRYAPEGTLPYPKAVIREALQLVLDLSAGRASSVHVEPGALSDEMVSTVKDCLALLDNFIAIEPDALPTDPERNEEVGRSAT